MIKIFSSPYHKIESEVNSWLDEMLNSIEVNKITQSSCSAPNGDRVYVTVMIEYSVLYD